MTSSASVHDRTEAAERALPVIACLRSPPRPPLAADVRYPRDRATIHRSAASTSSCTSRCGERPAGWPPAKLQHRRRALHTLVRTQRLVVQRPCEVAFLCSLACEPADGCIAVAMSPETARACQYPPFISSPSKPCRLQRQPAFSGAGQPEFDLHHEAPHRG